METQKLTEDDEILAKVMAERGYLVLDCDRPLDVGAIVPDFTMSGKLISQPMLIRSKTDRGDFHAQCMMIEEFGHKRGGGRFHYGYFYRVSTD